MRIAPVNARPVGNRSIQIRSSVFGVDDTRTELLPLPELELELLPEEEPERVVVVVPEPPVVVVPEPFVVSVVVSPEEVVSDALGV